MRQHERRHHVTRPLCIRRGQDTGRIEIRDARVVRHELVEDLQQRAPEFMNVDARVQPQQQRLETRIVE
jgi:hypothetical protein